jgi:hypothetical protein
MPEPLFMALFYTSTGGKLHELPPDVLINTFWAVAAVENAREANVKLREKDGKDGKKLLGSGTKGKDGSGTAKMVKVEDLAKRAVFEPANSKQKSDKDSLEEELKKKLKPSKVKIAELEKSLTKSISSISDTLDIKQLVWEDPSASSDAKKSTAKLDAELTAALRRSDDANKSEAKSEKKSEKKEEKKEEKKKEEKKEEKKAESPKSEIARRAADAMKALEALKASKYATKDDKDSKDGKDSKEGKGGSKDAAKDGAKDGAKASSSSSSGDSKKSDSDSKKSDSDSKKSDSKGDKKSDKKGEDEDVYWDPREMETRMLERQLRKAEAKYTGTYRPVRTWQQDLLDALGKAMRLSAKDFTPMACVKMIWALSQLRIVPEQGWMRRLITATEAHLAKGQFQPLELVYLTRCTAMLLDVQTEQQGDNALPEETNLFLAKAVNGLAKAKMPSGWQKINVRFAPYAIPRGAKAAAK